MEEKEFNKKGYARLGKLFNKPKYDGYSITQETGHIVYDSEVAEYVMKRLKPWDWLNPYKITSAVIWAHTCLMQDETGEDPDEIWKEYFS